MIEKPKAKHTISVRPIKRTCESCKVTEVAKRLGGCQWCALLVTDGAHIWAHVGPLPSGNGAFRVLPKNLAPVPELLAIDN